MPAHLVVLRPGLRWQTTGDGENSALQFRSVPTEHLRLAKQARVCARCILLGCTVCIIVGWWNCSLQHVMWETCRRIQSESHVGKHIWMLSVNIKVWVSDATAWYLSVQLVTPPPEYLWMQIDFNSGPRCNNRIQGQAGTLVFNSTKEEDNAPERELESRSDKSRPSLMLSQAWKVGKVSIRGAGMRYGGIFNLGARRLKGWDGG